jgi:hypothetical protein
MPLDLLMLFRLSVKQPTHNFSLCKTGVWGSSVLISFPSRSLFINNV